MKLFYIAILLMAVAALILVVASIAQGTLSLLWYSLLLTGAAIVFARISTHKALHAS